jgi:hypothetical protein
MLGSGPAAAFRHGMLRPPPDVVDLVVPASLHRRPRPGVRFHRRDLASADQVGLDGLDLTAPPLTVLDSALALPDGSQFLDRALQRYVRFPAVYRAYCRHLGRPGWSRMCQLITAAADRADSAAERLLVRILREGRVTGWVPGIRSGPGGSTSRSRPARWRWRWMGGWAWHVDPERFRNDRRKQNALVRDGWDPLRFTWHDLDGRPAATLAEIRETVAAAA